MGQYIRTVLVTLILLAAPIASMASATATQEEPDASDSWENAQHVPLGFVTGSLWFHDQADWYRVEIPVDHALRASVVHGPAWAYVMEVRGDDGSPIAHATTTDPVFVGLRAVRIGIIGDWGFYNLSFQAIPAPDVSVENVSVTAPTPIADGVEPIQDSKRTVEALLTIRQEDPGTVVRVDAWTLPSGTPTGPRHLGTQSVILEEGTPRLLTWTWDSKGQLGEVEIRVEASVPIDSDLTNDQASVSTFVTHDGLGFGVDALNVRHSEGGYVGHEVIVENHSDNHRVYLRQGLVTSNAIVEAGIGASGPHFFACGIPICIGLP